MIRKIFSSVCSVNRNVRNWLGPCVVSALALTSQWVIRCRFGIDRHNDPGLYFNYVNLWASGQKPYRDFVPEYPPGAMIVFQFPRWLGYSESLDDYRVGLWWVMAGFWMAVVWVIYGVSARLNNSKRYLAVLTSLLCIAGLCLQHLLTHSRFDLVPTLVALIGVSLSARVGLVVLGVAAGIKLWPICVVPYFIFLRAMKAGLSKTQRSIAALGDTAFVGLGLVVTAMPFMGDAKWEVLSFLEYHQKRGIEIESTWALWPYILEYFGHYRVVVESVFGGDHLVPTHLTERLRVVSGYVLAASQLVPFFGMLFRYCNGGPVPWTMRTRWLLMTGLLAGFIVFNKVQSPQYTIWIVPFLSLAWWFFQGWRRWTMLAMACGIPMLTYEIFPHHYTEYIYGPRRLGIVWGLARAVALCVTYGLCMFDLIVNQWSNRSSRTSTWIRGSSPDQDSRQISDSICYGKT